MLMITWRYIFINILLDTICPFVGYKSCPVLRFEVQITLFYTNVFQIWFNFNHLLRVFTLYKRIATSNTILLNFFFK